MIALDQGAKGTDAFAVDTFLLVMAYGLFRVELREPEHDALVVWPLHSSNSDMGVLSLKLMIWSMAALHSS